MPRGVRRPVIHQVPVFILTDKDRPCRACGEVPSPDEQKRLERSLARAKVTLRRTTPAALELARTERAVRLTWTCTECAMRIQAVHVLSQTTPMLAEGDRWLLEVSRSLRKLRSVGLELYGRE